MESVNPRFEFRAFAQGFGLVEEKMRELSSCQQIRESHEVYILSRSNADDPGEASRVRVNNVKIRDGKMDIKALVGIQRGLEQWTPLLKAPFPLQRAVIQDEFCAAMGVASPACSRSHYTLHQFFEEIVWPDPNLSGAFVFKRRFSFTVNECIAETAELLVNGAAIRTVAVESEDVEALLGAREMLGLQAYQNVSYPLALRRILGLEPPPGWADDYLGS
jgi:hypothetical protein